MGVAAADLHAATVLQQRQQVLFTIWINELLLTVRRERAERDVLRHQLRETLECQDEQREAVPPPDLLEEEPVRQPELL